MKDNQDTAQQGELDYDGNDYDLGIRLVLHDVFNRANTGDESYNRRIFAEAKSSILKWHNQQTAAVLNQLIAQSDHYATTPGYSSIIEAVPVEAIEAEIKKLADV